MTFVQAGLSVVVYVPDDFTRLQEALDETNGGDTIVCRAGTYYGPFLFWNRNVTLASEFVFTGDSAAIANCMIRPDPENRRQRCFDTLPVTGQRPQLRIIGMTMLLGRAYTDAGGNGGAIRIINRFAEIRDCVFKSNSAFRGGAVYCDSSSVHFTRCKFMANDARYYGSTFYVKNSYMQFDSSDIGPSGYINTPNFVEGEFHLDGCSLSVNKSLIHDLGRAGEARYVFWSYQSLSSPFIELNGCILDNCLLNSFMDGSSTSSGVYPIFWTVSCVVIDGLRRVVGFDFV